MLFIYALLQSQLQPGRTVLRRRRTRRIRTSPGEQVGSYSRIVFTVCVGSGFRLWSRPTPCLCAGGRRASTDPFDKNDPLEHYPSEPTRAHFQSPVRRAVRELPT